MLGWGSLRAVGCGVQLGMATPLRGAPSPVPTCWAWRAGACRVWVMPSARRLLWTLQPVSRHGTLPQPGRALSPFQALAVPDRAPVFPVAPSRTSSSLLGEKPAPGQAGAQVRPEHLRNSSTALAFPRLILVRVHSPASHPFQNPFQ